MNKKLRAARDASGKTQVAVAKAAGITDRHYQNIEYGKCVPSAIIATSIARALDTTAEELFGAATPKQGGPIDTSPVI